MGLFNWMFGGKEGGEERERLNTAIDSVIQGADPRLKALGDARARLSPAVAHALDFARAIVTALPPPIDLTPQSWTGTPLLRAMFVRPADVAEALSRSIDLREFLESPPALGMTKVHCLVAATRTERTVFGAAMEGDRLRQDVAQKTVGFGDYRLLGFSRDQQPLRKRIEDIVLEALVLAALRDISGNKQRGEQLEAYQKLQAARLRLMEQGGAGMAAMLGSQSHKDRDIAELRRKLAQNEAELAALKTGGSALTANLEVLVNALHNAEALMRPQKISLRLNAMNIVVGPEVADGADLELTEFSTANPDRPRRVAFLAAFPRDAFVERAVDFDAVLKTL